MDLLVVYITDTICFIYFIDVVYNSLFDVYYILKTDNSLLQIKDKLMTTLNNPSSLQLDWITRRLYWVEVCVDMQCNCCYNQ